MANDLPIRDPQATNPPNKLGGDEVSHAKSTAEPGPSLENPGDVIDGPANGPDIINR